MSGIPTNLVEALIHAHASHDTKRFGAAVEQVAARIRDSRRAERLRRMVSSKQLTELPHDVRGLVYDAPSSEGKLTLPDELQRELTGVVQEWAARERLLEVGLRPRSSLMFFGPPGNGKTTAAAQLARRIGLNPFVCSLPAIVDQHMGATGRNVDAALSLLTAGHALILDECEALGSARGVGSSPVDREANRIVSTMLTSLDRRDGGLLIGTTNRIDMLDQALLRRFDECLEFSAPDADELSEFMGKLMTQFGIGELTRLLEGEVTSYDAATKLVHKTVRQKVLQGDDRIRKLDCHG